MKNPVKAAGRAMKEGLTHEGKVKAAQAKARAPKNAQEAAKMRGDAMRARAIARGKRGK